MRARLEAKGHQHALVKECTRPRSTFNL